MSEGPIPWSGRRVLVTGGAGFIGSHLVEALVERGAEVRVFDDLSNGRRENLEAVADRIEFTVGDIRDADAVRAAAEGCDLVHHLAAIASVPRSVKEPDLYLDVNATGTMNVLEAARLAGARRVVYAGSSSWYGDQPGFPRVETMPPDVRSPYAAAKASGEFLARSYAACYELDAVTLRYFNIYGPRQRPDSPYAAVIPRFTMSMLRGEPVRVFGDGEQTRDFTYVANAVHANVLAAECGTRLEGVTVNVACGERRSVNALVARLAEATGIEPVVEHAEERPGEVRHSTADIGLAAERIGYAPVTEFDEGIDATVDWCRAWHARS